MTKKMVNGVLLDMTAEEEKEFADLQKNEPSDADRALGALRIERNKRLTETDWTASSDVTMTDAMTTYRQALRDITKNATSLDDVTWPEKP